MMSKKKKILLIEDEQMLAEIYKDKFTQAGFEVILAFDAKAGLDAAKKQKPNLILLDILLPGENGIAFYSQLKKESRIADIPVVAFSNYDDPETKKEAKRLGIKDYLIKTSFTPQQIVERIKRYLR